MSGYITDTGAFISEHDYAHLSTSLQELCKPIPVTIIESIQTFSEKQINVLYNYFIKQYLRRITIKNVGVKSSGEITIEYIDHFGEYKGDPCDIMKVDLIVR